MTTSVTPWNELNEDALEAWNRPAQTDRPYPAPQPRFPPAALCRLMRALPANRGRAEPEAETPAGPRRSTPAARAGPGGVIRCRRMTAGRFSVYPLCWRWQGPFQHSAISQDADSRNNEHRQARQLPAAQLGEPAVAVCTPVSTPTWPATANARRSGRTGPCRPTPATHRRAATTRNRRATTCSPPPPTAVASCSRCCDACPPRGAGEGSRDAACISRRRGDGPQFRGVLDHDQASRSCCSSGATRQACENWARQGPREATGCSNEIPTTPQRPEPRSRLSRHAGYLFGRAVQRAPATHRLRAYSARHSPALRLVSG